MVKILMTAHFQMRMMERGIDIDHIKQAIKNPDFTRDAYEGKILARKKIDEKRVIEVIYFNQGFKDSNGPVIVTAYYQDNE